MYSFQTLVRTQAKMTLLKNIITRTGLELSRSSVDPSRPFYDGSPEALITQEFLWAETTRLFSNQWFRQWDRAILHEVNGDKGG